MPITTALRSFLAIAALALPAAPLAAQHAHDDPPAAAAPPPLAPPSAQAPDTNAGRALSWLLALIDAQGNIDIADRFADELLAQVPADKLVSTLDQIRTALGGFVLRRIESPDPNTVIAFAETRTARSMWRISMHTVDAEPHKIDGLQFQPAPAEAIPPLAAWADADAALATLGAARSLAIYDVAFDGALTPVHTLNEREPLPIGSTFKLFVLGALADWMDKGGDKAPKWDETLTIDDDFKSLPSGVMQNLPRGSEAPLLEFATKMIAISDNTAADHVLRRVGRDRVEKFYKARVSLDAAAKTLPFLSTREMFNVKISMDENRMPAYIAASVDERRAMLAPGAEIASEAPSAMTAQQWRLPQGVDKVEWFASTQEMCKLMTELWRMSERAPLNQLGEICSKNRGLQLDEDTWDFVMFKGGSEPGVLNVTWFLQRAPYAKRDVPPKYVVSMSVMDTQKPLDEAKAIGLAQRAIEFLAKQ